MLNLLPKWTSAAVIITVALIAVSPAVRAADETKAKGDKAPATTQSADQPGPNRFYGAITAVDVNAKTFTVDNQTYTLIAESQVTKDDKTATIADAVVGEPARGSYTKASDGKLNVTKVRFGKKTGGGKAGGRKKDASSKPAEAATSKE